MSNNTDSWKTDPEHIELSKFLIEAAKDVTPPIHLFQLCKEFKEKTGSTQTNHCLNQRVLAFRDKVAEMTDFDTDTKVKLMFALSSPVDYGYLHELRKNADVTLDSYHRITEYKKKDGGLHLIGTHHHTETGSEEKDEEMLDFLAEFSKTAPRPVSNRVFKHEISEATGAHNSEWLGKRYKRIKKEIYESTRFDKETKIRMLFISGTKLPSYVLQQLQKEATVEVDEKNRITEYEAYDGSLHLKGDHSMSAMFKAAYLKKWKKIAEKAASAGSDDEDDEEGDDRKKNYMKSRIELIKFVTEKCVDVKEPLCILKLCRDYKDASGASETITIMDSRIHQYGTMIRIYDCLDLATKVKQLFGLSVHVDPEYLEELRKSAHVRVDEMHRIIRYEAHDGSLQLQGDHSLSAKMRLSRLERMKKQNADTSDSEDSEDTDEDDEDEGRAGKRKHSKDRGPSTSSTTPKQQKKQ